MKNLWKGTIDNGLRKFLGIPYAAPPVLVLLAFLVFPPLVAHYFYCFFLLLTNRNGDFVPPNHRNLGNCYGASSCLGREFVVYLYVNKPRLTPRNCTTRGSPCCQRLPTFQYIGVRALFPLECLDLLFFFVFLLLLFFLCFCLP